MIIAVIAKDMAWLYLHLYDYIHYVLSIASKWLDHTCTYMTILSTIYIICYCPLFYHILACVQNVPFDQHVVRCTIVFFVAAHHHVDRYVVERLWLGYMVVLGGNVWCLQSQWHSAAFIATTSWLKFPKSVGSSTRGQGKWDFPAMLSGVRCTCHHDVLTREK